MQRQRGRSQGTRESWATVFSEGSLVAQMWGSGAAALRRPGVLLGSRAEHKVTLVQRPRPHGKNAKRAHDASDDTSHSDASHVSPGFPRFVPLSLTPPDVARPNPDKPGVVLGLRARDIKETRVSRRGRGQDAASETLPGSRRPRPGLAGLQRCPSTPPPGGGPRELVRLYPATTFKNTTHSRNALQAQNEEKKRFP